MKRKYAMRKSNQNIRLQGFLNQNRSKELEELEAQEVDVCYTVFSIR